MTSTRSRFAFVPFLLLLTAAIVAFTLPQGEEHLMNRRYREAATALQEALPSTPVGEQDRVLLLLGEAQWLAGDRPAAVAALQRLLTEQAGSGYVPHARYLLAKVHEGSGDLRAAAEIYRAESERLTGFLRKEEVAKVYLDLADRAASQEPKDYGRVVTFCDLALDLSLRPERARGIELRAAEAALAGGDHTAAVQRLVPLLDRLPLDGGKRKAMLLLGRARLASGDRAGARTVLRDLIALGKEAEEAGDAAYEVALTFGVPQPSSSQLDRAVQALLDLRRDWPAHEKARVAQFLAAQCYQSVGRADDALRSLQAFLEAEAASGAAEVPAARAMRGDVLMQTGKLEPAIAAWREYLAQHPSHGDWERVQRAIVDAEWQLAKSAFEAGKDSFAVARERLDAFARAYPLDGRNPSVLLLRGLMFLQEENYDEARAEFARCVSKYPGREESSSAQLLIGEIFETKTFDYEKALLAYRSVTWGSSASVAEGRVARLMQTALRVRTPRVYRSDEQPGFVLTSRNVESVRVRVFRLDLEDYFRATHQATNVHDLDIEVIAADMTFDSRVDGYVRYRETERTVPLPVKEPGAYVVKVDDKQFEATTMVLVSDLALITKSSRHEFLVMTQNTVANRVEAGVKVVLGNAEKVLAEGVTDAQGFFRYRGEELKNHDDLRVFAVAPGGSGASSLDLSGMGFSAGLQPKCYLTTDRPLYQPGQRVQGKALVREVRDGVYALPQPTGYVLEAFSPSGQVVMLRDVAFTAFGSFAFELDLDAEAELGEWRLGVRHTSTGGQWHSTFQVGRYERPRLQLAIELTESVVYRGERIRGRLRATWFYGQPAEGRDLVLRMSLPDGSVVERRGTTNAAGELPFELPTEDFAEEAMAMLAAELPADGVRTNLAVPIATSELEIQVTTKQSVYLASE
ncbi:MAG: tetratricopeptide repeat protein, partial [Planctomycetota bacterium]